MYTKKYLLKCMDEFTEELGRLPTKKEISNRNCMPSYRSYHKYFGGINNVAILLQIQINKRQKWTTFDMIKAIKIKIRELKRVPTNRELIKSKDLPYPDSVVDKLGVGWRSNHPTIVSELIIIKEYLLGLDDLSFYKCPGLEKRCGNYTANFKRKDNKTHLGTFETKDEAKKARIKAEINHLKGVNII